MVLCTWEALCLRSGSTLLYVCTRKGSMGLFVTPCGELTRLSQPKFWRGKSSREVANAEFRFSSSNTVEKDSLCVKATWNQETIRERFGPHPEADSPQRANHDLAGIPRQASLYKKVFKNYKKICKINFL